jgi:hypothetical protein
MSEGSTLISKLRNTAIVAAVTGAVVIGSQAAAMASYGDSITAGYVSNITPKSFGYTYLANGIRMESGPDDVCLEKNVVTTVIDCYADGWFGHSHIATVVYYAHVGYSDGGFFYHYAGEVHFTS